MLRYVLPLGQMILALAILPAVFLLGGLGFFPIVADLLTGRGAQDLAGAYGQAVAVASTSVIAAFITCVVSAILFVRGPTPASIRLGIAGAVCYWIYVLGHFEMYWSDNHMTLWRTFVDTAIHSPDVLYYSAWDYPIAAAYGLVAVGLHSYKKRPS